jgi:hypothetical protein
MDGEGVTMQVILARCEIRLKPEKSAPGVPHS